MSGIVLLSYALIALISYFLYKQINRLKYWQKLGIPCEKPAFIYGNLNELQRQHNFADIFQHHYNKFKGTGPFSGFYWFHNPAALILDLDLVKNILIKDSAKFSGRGDYNNPDDDPLSGRLSLLDGHKWRTLRAKLTPTFTSSEIKFVYPEFMKVVKEFVHVFSAIVEKGAIIEVEELLKRFTTDVIFSCAFGIESNILRNPQFQEKSFEQRHGGIFTAFMSCFPNLARMLHQKSVPADVTKFFKRIVSETVEHRERNQVQRNDFMDMLIELKKKKKGVKTKTYTLKELAGQALMFYTAGFETSSSTMTFALYELARHQDIQQKAREEVQQIYKEHKELGYGCIKHLPYLDQIISETLRFYPVVPFLIRCADEDYTVPGHPRYVIKKGMRVLIPSGAIHRDADYYPNPDVFNPDNFLPEHPRPRVDAHFMPFGEGPRNFIGLRFGMMQTRMGLALLLKHFKFSVENDKTQIPIHFNKESIILRSKNGIYLKMEKL